MTIDAQKLFNLLPAVYRVRDAEQAAAGQDGPVKALLRVIAEPLGDFEASLEQLYDDLFIETCADWVVPYLGDLVGYRPLSGAAPGLGSPRSEVANTIAYRRRKGTAAMLEQLARDVTGWDARVVEFFEWLAWNQYMQHTRLEPPRGGTLNVRNHDACERIAYAAGALDTAARFVDLRDAARAGGRYHVSNIGVFFWRLHPYRVTASDARKVAAADDRYTFSPLGLDGPLFNRPEPETDITHLAGEVNVPGTLRRRVLHAETEARRRALANGRQTDAPLFFAAPPALQVIINDEKDPVPSEEVLICNLEDWRIPPASRTYTRADGVEVDRPIRVAVDPELGRLTVPAGAATDRLTVTYAYGFSADMGGGPYTRPQSTAALKGAITFQVGVSQDVAPVPGRIVGTLEDAVTLWNAQPAGTLGVIAILDSRTYAETLTGNDKIVIPEGSRLLIVAATWPEVDPGNTGLLARVVGQFVPAGVRPHILGDISIAGTARDKSPSPGELLLDGLLLEGNVTVLSGNLGGLTVSHCSLTPGKGIVVNASSVAPPKTNADLQVTIDHSICGVITLPDTVNTLRITDSIVSSGPDGATTAPAIEASDADGIVERSTIFGTSALRSIEGSNSIFAGVVTTVRRQVGCVRFSYLAPASVVPRQHKCQPDLEITARIDRAQQAAGTVPVDAAERKRIRDAVERWLVPAFTATQYAQPGYAQLRLSAPMQIRTGADDEAEMGAFHDLYQPQREANLRTRLDEYLRFGLTAGIIYVS